MVLTRYLLDQPAPRSSAKLFFDQQVMPGLINTAGAIEGLAERLAVTTRRQPLRTMAAGLVAGIVLGAFARLAADRL